MSIAVSLAALSCSLVASLPADMLSLGDIRLARGDETAVPISGEMAIAAAAADGYGFPNASAYLVTPNVPEASQRFDDPVRRTTTWVVRWNDLSFEGSRPALPPGVPQPPPRAPLNHLYVAVDPFTGRVLNAKFME